MRMTSSRHTDRGAPEGSGNRTELCLEVPTGCLQPFRGGCPRPSYPGRFHTVEATADSGQARTDRDVLRRGAGARGRADDRGGGLSTCYLLLQGRSGTGHSVGRRCSLSCWHGKKREKRRFTTWGAPGTPRGLHWNIHTGARHSEQGSWGE